MEIGFVYDAVHPWETGGVQTRVWEFARRLADDHDVHWFGLHYWEGDPVVEREGVTLHGVAPARDLYVDDRRSIREALAYSARLVGPLARADLDVVDCQEFPYFPVLASRASTWRADTPLVVTWHEVWGDYWRAYLGRYRGRVGRAVERICARVPDAHVAVSERTRRDLADLGVDDPALVPNGIDRDHVASVPPADEAVDVVFAGRLIPEKNPDLFVRAVADVAATDAGVRAWLLGEGPAHERTAALVDDLGLGDAVRMPGFLDDHDDVLGLLKAADVFALPSEREGFGITALEALACGTPVATVDHPRNAATGLVDDGRTGAITRPTPEAFADGIRRARECDATACERATDRYRWPRLAGEMEGVYERLAGR